MPGMDMSQLPPQVLQMLQQQQQSGAGSAGIEQVFQQLMQMSPDQVAQALQQMFGVEVTGPEVEQAAEGWLEQAGDAQASAGSTEADAGEDEASPPDATQSSASAEVEEPQADSESDEGELPPNAQPTGYSGGGGAGIPSGAMPSGGGAMPRMPRGGPTGPSVPGGSMDDLVSAAMMQSVAGNPNAKVPISARGAIPNPRPSGAADNTRNAAMIADLYKSTGGKTGKQRTPSAKPSSKA